MKSNKPKPQWSNIRKQLLLLDLNELIAQIKDLYSLSVENRRFLESRFAVEKEQVEAILAEYKQEIEYCFFGKRDYREFMIVCGVPDDRNIWNHTIRINSERKIIGIMRGCQVNF